MSKGLKNTIELNIYDDELNIVKTFKSYGLKWKTFKKIMGIQDRLSKIQKDDVEAVEVMGEMLSLVFPTLTEEDLNEVYTDDLWNCFEQAMTVTNQTAKNL